MVYQLGLIRCEPAAGDWPGGENSTMRSLDRPERKGAGDAPVASLHSGGGQQRRDRELTSFARKDHPNRTVIWYGVQRRLALLVAAGVAFVVQGCESAPPDNTSWSVSDSSGVRVVTNSGEDVPLSWRLEAAVTIGGEPQGPGSFYRIPEWGRVSADRAGNVYVLDGSNQRVVSFDSLGGFRRSFGSEGQGPGEIERALNLSVSADGDVAVYDWPKQGLVRFNSSGAFTELRRLDISYDGRQLQLVNGDVVFTRWPPGGDGHLAVTQLSPGGGTTVLAEASAPIRAELVNFERCGIQLPFGGPIFTHELFWFAGAGRFYVSPGPSYRIDVYEGQSFSTSIRRDLPPVAATRAMAEREVADGMAFGPCTVPANEVVDARGYAEAIPFISRFVISPDGGIWVGRWGGEPERELIDVFDAEGQYVGTLPAGTPLPVLFVGPNMVAIVRTDSLDVQRLDLMRVLRE